MSYSWSVYDLDSDNYEPSHNFTWNILPMFYEALGDFIEPGQNFARTFHARRAAECIEPFAKAHADMERYPDKYRPMNPSNGWGSYEIALEVMQMMRDACVAHPTWHFVVY